MRGRPKAKLVWSESEREQRQAVSLRRKTAQALAGLNQVESWFASLAEKYLRCRTHRSTRQLKDAIHHYLEVYNPNARPFVWIGAVEDIPANIE